MGDTYLKNLADGMAGKALNAGPGKVGGRVYREALVYRGLKDRALGMILSGMFSRGGETAGRRPVAPHTKMLDFQRYVRTLSTPRSHEFQFAQTLGFGRQAPRRYARGTLGYYPPDSRFYPGVQFEAIPRGMNVTRYHNYHENRRAFSDHLWVHRGGVRGRAPRKDLMSLVKSLFTARNLNRNYLPDAEALDYRQEAAEAVVALRTAARQNPRVAQQAVGGTFLSVQDAEIVNDSLKKGTPVNSDKRALQYTSANSMETAVTRPPDYMFPVPSRTREIFNSVVGAVESLGGGALVDSAMASLRSSVVRTLLVSRAKIEIFLRRAEELGHKLIPITSNDGGDDVFCSVRGQYILVCRDPWFPAWIEISRYIGEDNASGRITVPRLYANRLLRYIDEAFEDMDFVQLTMMEHYGSSPIGAIPRRKLSTFHTDGKFARAAEDINTVANLRDRNTGVMLYGPPGNGKSHWIRCMAARYGLPLCNVQLRSIDDTSLIRMCINAPAAAILLMEDFDALYKGREEALALASSSMMAASVPSPSFSVLLNIMDGNALTRKGLVFCITTNNIDVIDPALKDRPSRFKHLLEFENPDDKILERVFLHLPPAERAHHVQMCRGQNLDQVLAYRDFKGLTPPPIERPAGARES